MIRMTLVLMMLALIFVKEIQSQNVTWERPDTIYSYPFHEIKVGPIFSNPITEIRSFRAVLKRDNKEIKVFGGTDLNKNLSQFSTLHIGKARETENCWIAELKDGISNLGDYTYEISFNGINSNVGTSKNYKSYYHVKIIPPILADQNLVKRDSLYFGEKLTFNIAALGLDDTKDYSYEVRVNGETKLAGDSNIVKIDLSNAPLLDTAKTTLNIIAKYKGIAIVYDGIGKLSSKTFVLRKPFVDVMSLLQEPRIKIDLKADLAQSAFYQLIGHDHGEYFLIPFHINDEKGEVIPNSVDCNYPFTIEDKGYYSRVNFTFPRGTDLSRKLQFQINLPFFQNTLRQGSGISIIR